MSVKSKLAGVMYGHPSFQNNRVEESYRVVLVLPDVPAMSVFATSCRASKQFSVERGDGRLAQLPKSILPFGCPALM